MWSGTDELAEYDVNGDLIRRFIPDGTGGMDQRLATVTASGAVYWHHTDHLGSVIATSDSNGQTVGVATYSPHGEGAPPLHSPFGFTGRQYDPETGLYYYRARYYSPYLGQFLTTDPIGTKDDPNLYMYVGLDPANATDPTGEDTLKVYDPNQAIGLGHVAAAHVASNGAVTFGNLTGDGRVQSNGEIEGAEGLKVGVDANGDVTEAGIAQIAKVLMNHWQTDPGESGSGMLANVSVFRDADDTVAFQRQLSAERSTISGEGLQGWGPLTGSFSPNGRTYGLTNNNCSHLANRLVQSALPASQRGYYVGGPARSMSPNSQFRNEGRSGVSVRSYRWTGR
jgi:RHS repeat-associated protein